MPVAGTVLMKNYKGRSIQVRVLPNSSEYEGEQYKTLTSIARIVTDKRTSMDFNSSSLVQRMPDREDNNQSTITQTARSILVSRPKKGSSKSSIRYMHNANPPNVALRARKPRAGFACRTTMMTVALHVAIAEWNFLSNSRPVRVKLIFGFPAEVDILRFL